jgi:hypothetical protein
MPGIRIGLGSDLIVLQTFLRKSRVTLPIEETESNPSAIKALAASGVHPQRPRAVLKAFRSAISRENYENISKVGLQMPISVFMQRLGYWS